MEDKGKSVDGSSAQSRAPTRARRASWASEDVLPALSRRAAELEALARSLQADLDNAQRQLAVYSEFDRPLQEALVEAYGAAEAIQQRARGDADSVLEHALDERRLLLKDVERLRRERDHLTNEIVFARRGGLVSLVRMPEPVQEPPARDHRLTLSTEMRLILRALFEESFGPRPPVPTPTPATTPRTVLRARPSTQRKRPVSPRTSKAAPAPKVQAIVAEPFVHDLGPVEVAPLPTTEVSKSTVATADAPSIVIEATATVRETEPVAEPTEAPVEGTQAIVAELEIAQIAPSDDLFGAIETTVPVPDQAVETVEPIATVDAVAAVEAVETTQHIAAHIPMANVLPETTIEPAVEYVISEPTRPVADTSRELITELNVSADLVVEDTLTREVTPGAPPLATPALEPTQPARLASTDSLAQLWDTAVAATGPRAEVVSPSAPFVSPTEMPVEEVLPESQPIETEAQSFVERPPVPQQMEATVPDPVLGTKRAVRQLQLVLSPIDSFAELLEIEGRIASLSSVHSLLLREFRNGVATFVTGVADALDGPEFGALLQMLGTLRLRLEAASDDSVELRVMPAP